MERLDRNNGQHVAICSTIVNQTTPCSQITRDGLRFIYFPLLRQCCMCCDSAHGCGFLKRDWLKNSKFAGTDIISGQTFNKFVDTAGAVEYWSTTDKDQIPRKLIEDNERIKDWIMNTFSEEYIAASIFALPSYCSSSNLCPADSKCGKFMQWSNHQNQNIIINYSFIKCLWLKTDLTFPYDCFPWAINRCCDKIEQISS